MMSTQRLSICTVQLKSSVTWNTVLENLLLDAQDDSRCIITEESDVYVSGCYIVRVMQNQMQYNLETNTFETVAIARTQVLKFDMYPQKELMMLWGSKKAASLFTTALAYASNNSIILDYKKADYKSIVQRMLNNTRVSFTKMNVTNVIIEPGVVANCSINLSNQESVPQLVRKYIDNISTVSIQFDENDPTSMTLYSSGAVVVYRDRDDIPTDVIEIINIMIGGIV